MATLGNVERLNGCKTNIFDSRILNLTAALCNVIGNCSCTLLTLFATPRSYAPHNAILTSKATVKLAFGIGKLNEVRVKVNLHNI